MSRGKVEKHTEFNADLEAMIKSDLGSFDEKFREKAVNDLIKMKERLVLSGYVQEEYVEYIQEALQSGKLSKGDYSDFLRNINELYADTSFDRNMECLTNIVESKKFDPEHMEIAADTLLDMRDVFIDIDPENEKAIDHMISELGNKKVTWDEFESTMQIFKGEYDQYIDKISQESEGASTETGTSVSEASPRSREWFGSVRQGESTDDSELESDEDKSPRGPGKP